MTEFEVVTGGPLLRDLDITHVRFVGPDAAGLKAAVIVEDGVLNDEAFIVIPQLGPEGLSLQVRAYRNGHLVPTQMGLNGLVALLAPGQP